MTDRETDFMRLYRKHRVEDQAAYYGARRTEFEAAQSQANWLVGIVMILASAFAFVAASGMGPLPALWRILAASLPAVAAALAAAQRLFAFERLAKLYQDAGTSLATLGEPPAGASAADVQAYVTTAERIFTREQGQWGQLTADLQLRDGGGEHKGRHAGGR
jgi:SMODS and SLOG-associating 2TM effector domain 1